MYFSAQTHETLHALKNVNVSRLSCKIYVWLKYMKSNGASDGRIKVVFFTIFVFNTVFLFTKMCFYIGA